MIWDDPSKVPLNPVISATTKTPTSTAEDHWLLVVGQSDDEWTMFDCQGPAVYFVDKSEVRVSQVPQLYVGSDPDPLKMQLDCTS